MRRLVSLFFAFALAGALTGCVSTSASSPAPAATPTASPTTAPTPTATPLSSGEQVFLPNGALPQASYEPIAQPERFYNDTTKELIPSDEYGHIWPYVGGFLTDDWGKTALYGLCDDKGRIICDPAFHKVDVLEKDGGKLYEFIKYTGNAKSKFQKLTKITLARPDGNWAVECDEMYISSPGTEFPPIGTKDESKKWISWRQSIALEYITIRKGDKWGAIDYNGNEILPCTYSAPLFFSEGLAAVISDDGKKVYYIDKTGKTIIGPFEMPPKQDNSWQDFSFPLPDTYALLFSEGKMRFFRDGKFGVIDKSGNIIVPAKYDYISSYSGGTAEFISGGKFGILGANGEVLTEATDKKLDKISSSGMRDYTLSNGNTVEKIDGSTTWQIVNSSGKTVAGPFYGWIDYYTSYGIDTYHLLLIKVGRTEHSTFWDFELLTLYDEEGNNILPGAYVSIQPFDGRYLVRTENAAGLMKDGGEWIIEVPLFDFMKD